MIGVTERNQGGSYAAFRGEFPGWPGENKEGFAAWFLADIDVAPAHCLTNAGAECLRNSFFAGETRGQMARRKFHRHRILDLALGKNAMKKAFAETVKRMLNARTFDQIDADADDAHLKFELSAGNRRAVSHGAGRSRSALLDLTALNGQVQNH